jgi:hypothetical protein
MLRKVWTNWAFNTKGETMTLKDKFKFTTEDGEGRVYTAVRKGANQLHVTWEDDEHGWTYFDDNQVEEYIRDGNWTIIDEAAPFPRQFVACPATSDYRYILTQVGDTDQYEMVSAHDDEEHGTRHIEQMKSFLRCGSWERIEEIPEAVAATEPSEFDTLLEWCEEVGAKVTMQRDGTVSLDIFNNVMWLEDWNHLKRLQPLVTEYNVALNKLIDVGFDV